MSTTIFSDEHKDLVNKLRETRIQCGLSQTEVSNQLNKTQSYISKVESGQIKIDVITLKKLANLYNKEISYFIGEVNK